MQSKFKDELKGERLILKRAKPNINTAETMFKTVEENREYLKPWFVWEKRTQKSENCLDYLLKKTKNQN